MEEHEWTRTHLYDYATTHNPGGIFDQKKRGSNAPCGFYFFLKSMFARDYKMDFKDAHRKIP